MDISKERISWKKGVACAALFLGLLFLTIVLLFKDQDPAQLMRILKQASLPWLLIGAGCMVFSLCCEAWNIQRGLKIFGSPAPYRACLRYAIIGFFFSSVTPSASGGQPMQLYEMYRDGHPPAQGALALLTEFFSFQLAAVIIALTSFFLCRQEILSLNNGVCLLFFVGTALNLIAVLVLAASVFSPKVLPVLWGWLMRPAQRLFPSRADQWKQWGKAQITDLHHCAARYREERITLMKCFCTSLVQVVVYHSIPYWISLSLGITGQAPWEMVGLQAVLFLSVSSLPLPGAVGLSEGGFLLFFRSVFPAAVLSAGMILSRTVSFYLFLFLSGFWVAIYSVSSLKKHAYSTR